MFFNWFSSSFMLYGIALNWQVKKGFKSSTLNISAPPRLIFEVKLNPGHISQGLTGGLFINFLIAAILDFPGKLLALMSLVLSHNPLLLPLSSSNQLFNNPCSEASK